MIPSAMAATRETRWRLAPTIAVRRMRHVMSTLHQPRAAMTSIANPGNTPICSKKRDKHRGGIRR
jgi:hypothetical protein